MDIVSNLPDAIFQSVVVLPAMLAVVAAYVAVLSLMGKLGTQPSTHEKKEQKVVAQPSAPTMPAVTPDATVQKRPMPAVYLNEPDWNPSAMAVRDLNQGKATLILRSRPKLKAVTVQLIIWAGEARKKKKKKFEDSLYDLGFLPSDGGEISHQVIAQAVAEAQKKLIELAKPKQSEATQAELATVPAQAAAAVSADVAAEKGAEVIPPAPDQGEAKAEVAVKMKKTPVVFRGTIISAGYMPRPLQGEILSSFGVRYRTNEGIEDAVWGVDLRRAMDAANVKVGDFVEILRVGRKTMEKGKAPMNLYQIAKIGAGQAASV